MATETLILASSRHSLHQIEPFLVGQGIQELVSAKTYHNMLVAVLEAVNNAIVHGHHEDVSKSVTVRLTTLPTIITITIEDSGAGFDATSVPDPRLPENILKEGGRGVFLMREFADEVRFDVLEHGMRVELLYKL